ncbi:flagellar biosynthesis protein FlhF [Bdellovibrionota bacterium FG-1]
MQVKKFEAPTIQEALEVIKRELGPEAIILQTRKMKKGFGLMSKESVEVTAAVSERSIQKKTFTEARVRDSDRDAIKKMPANRQGDLYDRYSEKKPPSRVAPRASHEELTVDRRAEATRDQIEIRPKRLTATRYADISDGPSAPAQAAAAARVQATVRERGVAANAYQAETLEAIAQGRVSRDAAGAVMGQPGAGRSVEEEVRYLKRMIEEMKTTQESSEGLPSSAFAGSGAGAGISSPALHDAFEQLVLNGMDRRYALGLIKKSVFEIGEARGQNPEYVLEQLAVEVMQSTEILSPLGDLKPESRGELGPMILALVGPTGVGKTTTVAKLASEALLKRNLKVGLINLDSYKVAAFDQLGTYAKILNVPFRSAENAEELRAAVRDFAGMDLILIDTAGRSQRDPEALKQTQTLLQTLPEMRTQLVLSVTTRDHELYDQANRFSVFKPQGLIFSKLDEATLFGAIYNVSQKAKLPLLYFTTGQRVPEDIENATRERVAALIMDL